MDPADAPPAGALIVSFDDVRVGRVIGSGGFGVVYEGTYKGEPAAIKIVDFKAPQAELTAGDQDFLINEIQLMISAGWVAPDHALPVKGWGFVPGSDGNARGFIVLALMDGDLNSPAIRVAPVPTRLAVLRRLAEGLRVFHHSVAKGGQLVHADLKPGNLLYRRDGDHLDVRISDFGMAKVRAIAAGGVLRTVSRAIFGGTADYMAPEILMPAPGARTTTATDVYAFAILAWELLSGERPWQREYTADPSAEFTAWLKRSVALGELRPNLGALPADVPAPVRDVIARAWAKAPAARPTFTEISAVLAAHARSPVPAELVAPAALAPAVPRAPAPTVPSAAAVGPAAWGGGDGDVFTTVSRFRHIPRTAADASANVDVVIVMDCTSSMTRFISEAKTRAREIVEKIRDNDASGKIRVGFVGYRDYVKPDDGQVLKEPPAGNRIVALSITEQVAKFEETLLEQTASSAKGTSDYPEDVAGALRAALYNEMDWQSPTKVIIHFLDAPPHGTDYHDLGEKSDHYPRGDPKGSRIEALVEDMARRGIHYVLVQVNHSVRFLAKMTRIMQGVYTLHTRGRCMDVRSLSDAATGLSDEVARSVIKTRDFTRSRPAGGAASGPVAGKAAAAVAAPALPLDDEADLLPPGDREAAAVDKRVEGAAAAAVASSSHTRSRAPATAGDLYLFKETSGRARAALAGAAPPPVAAAGAAPSGAMPERSAAAGTHAPGGKSDDCDDPTSLLTTSHAHFTLAMLGMTRK